MKHESWRSASSLRLVKLPDPAPAGGVRYRPAAAGPHPIPFPSIVRASLHFPLRRPPPPHNSPIHNPPPRSGTRANRSTTSNRNGGQVRCRRGRSGHRPPPQAPEAWLGRGAGCRDKIYRKMGEGTFGQVLECWDRESKEMVAIKVIRSVQKYSDAAMIEIDVLQKLARNDASGKHCVQIRNWFDYRSHICIVCEKLGPSLYDFLRKTGYRPCPIDLVRQIGEQLLESVAFMHRLQLIHTDLKPENILLVSSDYVKLPDSKDGSFSRKLPKSSAIKLIDFGSAAYHHQDRSYIVSTRHYRAPEVILGHGWSYPCDIWSVGCILVELCSGETLFQTHENLEHLAMMERVLGSLPRHMLEKADQHAEKYVRRGKLNWPEGATTRESIRAVLKLPRLQNLVMQHVDHSAGDFIDLLKRLLAYEPSARLTAEEALSHGFFTRYGERRSL